LGIVNPKSENDKTEIEYKTIWDGNQKSENSKIRKCLSAAVFLMFPPTLFGPVGQLLPSVVFDFQLFNFEIQHFRFSFLDFHFWLSTLRQNIFYYDPPIRNGYNARRSE
jgi:hypothetical protein